MSFTSTGFILFVAAAAIIYRLVPRKLRLCAMLLSSYIFYAVSSVRAVAYLAGTTLVSFAVTVWMQKIQDETDKELETLKAPANAKAKRKHLKMLCKQRKKRVAAIGLLFCFGVLAVLKYSNFVLLNLSPLVNLFNKNNAPPPTYM